MFCTVEHICYLDIEIWKYARPKFRQKNGTYITFAVVFAQVQLLEDFVFSAILVSLSFKLERYVPKM